MRSSRLVVSLLATLVALGACTEDPNPPDNTTATPSITTVGLPDAYNGEPYDQTLTASGGTPGYTFDLAAGALPEGLVLSPTGRLSGTVAPSATSATFTARVTDASGAQATRDFTLTVSPRSGQGLEITTAQLANATEGIDYRRSEASAERLETREGQTPYTWVATGLPAGLSLDAVTGELRGTPAPGSAGTHSVSFTVTDAGGRRGDKVLTLEVGKPRPLGFSGGVVGLAPKGSSITDTLTVFAADLMGTPLAQVGVRVRKNGNEYSPVKEALTDAEGKVVFTGLGLNGSTDTVDITANGKELVNVTYAQVNASLVTLLMSPVSVLGGRYLSFGAHEPGSGRFFFFGGTGANSSNTLFGGVCGNDLVELTAVAPAATFQTRIPAGLTTSPSSRYDGAMAVAGGVAVFFGGRPCTNSGDALGDTWELDPSTLTWRQVNPTVAPSPRNGAALVRDAAGTSVFLVGGGRITSPYSNEVWRYTPADDTWTRVGTAPFSRMSMGATVHTGTGELWFCGGRGSSGASAECHTYNPTSQVWTPRPALPSARSELAMAYDPFTENLYAFGGSSEGFASLGDLLVLRKNATAWQTVTPAGDTPSARGGHLLYFDLARKELVLALGYSQGPTGGLSRSADVWTYDGSTWTPRSPRRTASGLHTLSGTISGGAANSSVMVTLTMANGYYNSTSVTLDAQGKGSYTMRNVPPGGAVLISAVNEDWRLAFPNDLWSFMSTELASLTGDTTLNLTLPPGPLVRLQLEGRFILPKGWRGRSVTAGVEPLLQVPGFAGVPNGTQNSLLTLFPRFAMSYVRATAPHRVRANAYFQNAVTCDYQTLSLDVGSTGFWEVPVTGMGGLSPGQAECIPAGPSGLGHVSARTTFTGSGLDRPVVADMDGDSYQDLVAVRTASHDVLVSFQSHYFAYSLLCCDVSNPHSVAVADFDKDGAKDLAITDPAKGRVMVKLARDFEPRRYEDPIFLTVGTQPGGLTTADVDGDRAVDLLVANQGSNTVTFLPHPPYTFGNSQTVTLAGTALRAVLAAHLDGDTLPDLVAVVAEGLSIALDGTGNGPFGVSKLVPTGGTRPSAVVVGQLNGDALPDLAVANEGSHTVSLLFGTGGGDFVQSGTLAAGQGPVGLELAELTGDTHLDLAVSSPIDGVVTLYQGASNGTFTLHSRIPVPGDPRGLAAMDYDSDGLGDLVVTSPSTDAFFVLRGQRPLPEAGGDTFSFVAPAEAGFLRARHAVNGYRGYWDYYAPLRPGPVSYKLPQPSTLAPSAAPEVPARGKVALSWSTWVAKWRPGSPTPFNPRQFTIDNLGQDATTELGAHGYLWP